MSEHTPNITHQYFYIAGTLPSSLFPTLEDAENSAEFHTASTIKYYRLTTHPNGFQHLRFISVEYRR